MKKINLRTAALEPLWISLHSWVDTDEALNLPTVTSHATPWQDSDMGKNDGKTGVLEA